MQDKISDAKQMSGRKLDYGENSGAWIGRAKPDFILADLKESMRKGMWEGGILEVWAKKSGKPTSRRYNHLPLLPSGPGGVRRELAVPICRYKSTGFIILCKL